MRLWTIGLLFFLGSSSCASLNDQIQSRNLDGRPQSVGIIRRGSTREADYIEQIDIPLSSIVTETTSGEENVDADDDDEVVIKHSDLAGGSGVLIVRSGVPSYGPLVFAVRPVLGNSNNNKKYLKMQIFDDSEFSDNDDDDDTSLDFGDISDGEDWEEDFEDYLESLKKKKQSSKNKQFKRKQSINSQIIKFKPDSTKYNIKSESQSQSTGNEVSPKKIRILVFKKQLNPLNNKKKNCNGNNKNIDGGKTLSTAKFMIIDKESDLQGSKEDKSSAPVVFKVLNSNGRLPNKEFGLRKRYNGQRKEFE